MNSWRATRSRIRLTALLAAPAILLATLGVAGTAQAAAARPPVPVTVGYCTLRAASVTVTGGRVIAHSTVICRRHPDHFTIGMQIQFKRGRKWVMRTMATSDNPPFTFDVLGRAYLLRSDCLKKTRVRLAIIVRTQFGLHRYIKGIDYPSTRGVLTRGCDEI